MKTTFMIASVLAAGTSAVYAQEPPVALPPAAQQVPAATAPVPGSTDPAPLSAERLSEVRMLENIFVKAVDQGAAGFAHRMETTDPGSMISGSVTVGPAHARGIALEGYGVFFDVDVPLMNVSVVWTQRQIFVQNLRDQISDARRLRAHATSPDDQQQLDARIQLLTNTLYTVAPAPDSRPAPAMATPVANAAEQPAAGAVVAQTTDSASAAPLSANEMYTDAVKKSLMDAMLNHSSGLMLGADEWLTVAARDNGPEMPNSINDRSGIILRIKGGDLAAFRAGKLNRDEVLRKIEIREWR